MVNVIPPDHVDDVPVVEPNQHDDVPVVPEPVLVDKDEDLEEDKFKEEEDDMEVDIEEDENEPELTYPYEEVDPLNPPPPASESKPDDEIEVEDAVESEDETVPTSVYKVGEMSTTPFLCKDSDGLLPGLMRRDINSLFGRMDSFKTTVWSRDGACTVRSSVEQGTAAMEKLVEKLGNTEDKVECKKLKKELEEARFSNTFLRMQNERVERDLYWTKVRADEFYQEMIRRGFARQANVRNDASGSGPVRGRDTALAVRECTFAGFMKCNHAAFYGIEGAVELRKWFEKTESIFEISECAEGKKVRFTAATLEGPSLTWWKTKVATMGLETMNRMPWTEMKQLMTAEFNELALMCPRMVEPERVKVDAYIRGLTDNIKGEVISSKPVDLNEAKRKWESHQIGNGSGKGNQRDNSRQTLQNNQKQGNALAMVTAPTDGKLPLCEHFFTRHVGQCTIKCHKCGKVGHKS
ncbi:hypothetical protein Tco_0810454, partial [Tanacetum coccineum]